jgi:putative SOS response-associated peptidase YedK
MCNSYSVTKAMLKESKRAGKSPAIFDGGEDWKLIRPTLPGPVFAKAAAGEDLVAEIMRWGFHRPFANAVNNTRSDKLESPMWREAFAERRCVIPISAWYEYSGPQGRKQAHQFTSASGGLLWAAGIWEENATLGRCYSMIMTDANAFVSKIHNRMPALLGEEELEAYLSGLIVRPAPAELALAVCDAANPLKKKPTAIQQELF